METVTRITPLRGRLTVWRRAGEVIGFVPTMGNLHTGHLSLVEMTKARADRVVVSVFVNPSQFGPAEDYAGYPRTLDEDKRLLTEAGVDLLFAPEVEEVYPDGQVGEARIEVPGLSDILCGAVRPGHFSGVATVVAKLFNMVQPDIGVFGEKDYQQLLVIRKLVKDLNFPVEVLGAPIGREEDGLACSSRNRYLTADQRKRAPVLNQLLRRATEKLESGNRDYKLIETEALKSMEQAGFNPDYFEVREAADLSLPGPESTHVVVVAAGHLGKARLIDNAMATIPDH